MRKISIGVVLALILQFCYAKDASDPGAAFLSLGRYTNAFFGFSLPLPPDPAFQIAQVSTSGMLGTWHGLFGLVRDKGHTVFTIRGQAMMPDQAQRLMRAAPELLIHGKEFSRGISQEKGPVGTVSKAMYLTVVGNWLLEFNIESLDPNMAENLEHCVEQTTFFDPDKAREIAGPNGKPYKPASLKGP
jgi:hypothetical protein